MRIHSHSGGGKAMNQKRAERELLLPLSTLCAAQLTALVHAERAQYFITPPLFITSNYQQLAAHFVQ
jgi:hypothetical protein